MNEIISNLHKARAVLEQAPEERFDLRYFKNYRSDCGTLFCAAGWLCQDEEFQKKGFVLVQDSQRILIHLQAGPATSSGFRNYGWVDEVLGEDAFGRLFAEYGNGSLDKDLLGLPADFNFEDCEPPRTLSDKELALARIDLQIKLVSGGLHDSESVASS